MSCPPTERAAFHLFDRCVKIGVPTSDTTPAAANAYQISYGRYVSQSSRVASTASMFSTSCSFLSASRRETLDP